MDFTVVEVNNTRKSLSFYNGIMTFKLFKVVTMSKDLPLINNVEDYEDTLRSIAPSLQGQNQLVGLFVHAMNLIAQNGMPNADEFSAESITFNSEEDLFVKMQVLSLQYLKVAIETNNFDDYDRLNSKLEILEASLSSSENLDLPCTINL